mgnify:CR=1 FL=1
MKQDVVPVQIRGILPANSGCALFVGNDDKVFVINVEPQMGAVIGMFLRDTPKERPLTHDLMNRIFQGFGINVERVIITDLKNSTYFARLTLQQENELGRKLVELDARQQALLRPFRQLTEELVTLLTYEATRGIKTEPVEVVTPVAPMTGTRLAEPRAMVVPILRAGLGMLDGMTRRRRGS